MAKVWNYVCDGCGYESPRSRQRQGVPPDWAQHWHYVSLEPYNQETQGLYCDQCWSKMIKAVRP